MHRSLQTLYFDFLESEKVGYELFLPFSLQLHSLEYIKSASVPDYSCVNSNMVNQVRLFDKLLTSMLTKRWSHLYVCTDMTF